MHRLKTLRLPILATLLSCVLSIGAAAVVTGGTAAAATARAASSSATIGMPSQLISMDPDISLDPFGQSVLHLIGGTLYELVNGKPVASLAKSSTTSSNGLTWTFTLHKKLAFSNGAALTASDVAATITRSVKDKKNVNPSYYAAFKSVSAKGSGTVVVHLKHPYPELPTLLSYPQFAVFPAKDLSSSSFFKDPVSAGPYEIVSAGANTVRLVTNPRYVGPAADISKLKLEVVSDANSALSQVQSGQLTMAYSLPANIIPVIPSDELQVVDSYGLDAAVINLKKSPLTELGVRRAISAAINRQQMSQLAWDNKVPAQDQVWPATLAGYNSSIKSKVNDAAAKKYLSGTSCAKGCSITVTYSPDEGAEAQQEAVVMQSDLQAIGIKVTLTQVDATGFNNAYLGNNFEMLLTPLFVGGPIPDDIVNFALPIGSNVYSTYPGMEAALTKSLETAGAAKDKELAVMNKLIMNNVPWIPLTGAAEVSATKSKEIVALPGRIIGIKRKDGSVR